MISGGRRKTYGVPERVHRIYHDERVIALLPVVALAIDYSLTFFFAGSRETLLLYEASPLLKFAVANNLFLMVIIALMIFYYLGSWIILKLLAGSDMYPVGVTLIALISLTHVLGGMSWYIRAPLYSNTVVGLSVISIMVAILVFGYTILRSHHGGWT